MDSPKYARPSSARGEDAGMPVQVGGGGGLHAMEAVGDRAMLDGC